jgi:uncharacterized protein (TIGR03000 family)
MNRFDRIGWRWVILLSLVLLAGVSRPAWAEDKKPVHLDILLPEDAELEVAGYKTKSTGETRRFESPPMQMGRTYRYSLKIVWRGHTLTRRIQVRPEHPFTLDLRKELQALASPPKPAGSFALLVPPGLMLRADQQMVFPLRVKRFDFPGSIRIRFEDLPKGITVPEVKFSEDESENNAMLFAAADAPQGTYEIRVAAASGAAKDVSTIKITVAKPETKIENKPEKKETEVVIKPEKKEPTLEKKPEEKPALPLETEVERKPEPAPEKTVEDKSQAEPAPLPKPKPESKPSPALRVSLPSQIVLCPGQSKYIEVKAALEKQGPFPAEPTITLAAPPESNLTWKKWTSSDFKLSPTAHTVGFAIRAPSDSKPGERRVKVLVTAGSLKAEHTLTVIVKPLEPVSVLKVQPIPPLQLVLPTGVVLKQGRTRHIEMQVKTMDGSPLPEAPSVTPEDPSGSGLRFAQWTVSFKAGEPVCTVGIAVTAETNALAGDKEVRVRAVAGRSTAEQLLRVTVVGQ